MTALPADPRHSVLWLSWGYPREIRARCPQLVAMVVEPYRQIPPAFANDNHRLRRRLDGVFIPRDPGDVHGDFNR